MADFITTVDADRILNRFLDNVRRSKRLIETATVLHQTGNDAGDDVLRSSIVFLHAALEDLLRSIGRLRLPTAKGEVLASIPLVNQSGLGEDRRFTLRQVALHRGLTVDDLIYQSVRSYLERKSFSSTTDIVEFLRKMLVEEHAIQPHLPALAALIARRHRIVHRADLVSDTGSSLAVWTGAEIGELTGWVRAVVSFGSEVLRESLQDTDRSSWAFRILPLAADLLQ